MCDNVPGFTDARSLSKGQHFVSLLGTIKKYQRPLIGNKWHLALSRTWPITFFCSGTIVPHRHIKHEKADNTIAYHHFFSSPSVSKQLQQSSHFCQSELSVILILFVVSH